MKWVPFRSRTKGFGLLEIILVIALVIAAGAVVFTVFESAQPSSEASHATEDLTVLAADIKGAYAVGHDYAAVDTAALIRNRLVPASMVNSAGTGLVGLWNGQPVTIVPETASPSPRFVIVYEGISAEACVKFIQGAAPYFEDVAVGTSASGPGTPVRTASGPLAMGTLVTLCDSSTPLVAFFTAR